MKQRAWLRPHLVVAGIVGLVFLVRVFVVPPDFGVGDRGYRFAWHRAGNEQDWKNVTVKYAGSETCAACHVENATAIKTSFHAPIQCENCHGPKLDHPADPAKLPIDTSRAQCLRCHFPLAYPTSGRAAILSVDPVEHNPDIDCVVCHNPHHPNLEAVK